MSKIRKTASKVHRAAIKIADPVGHAIMKDRHPDAQLADKIEDTTAKHVWGTPIDPEEPEPIKDTDKKDPAVMELPDEEEIERARRRGNSRRRASSGRASTILTNGGGSQGLGG